MRRKIHFMTHGALLAALYAALTYLQNLLIPGSATWAIQFRASEALCVLAFFTPSAIPGLAVGCLLFNISAAGALALDFLLGTAASAISASSIWLLRKKPGLGLLMPPFFNGLLVGWELTIFVGGGFWLNALYVAIGEAAVMLTLGVALYLAIKQRKLEKLL